MGLHVWGYGATCVNETRCYTHVRLLYQCPASLDVIHSELQSAERSFQSHEVEMVQRRDGMLAQVQKAA